MSGIIVGKSNEQVIKEYLNPPIPSVHKSLKEIAELNPEDGVYYHNLNELLEQTKASHPGIKSISLLANSYEIQKLFCACSLLPDEDKGIVFIGLITGNTILTLNEATMLYETTVNINPCLITTDSLRDEVFEYASKAIAVERGLYLDEKGKVSFDKVKFSKYLLKRVNMLSQPKPKGKEILFIFSNDKGIYLNDMGALKRIITMLMNTALYDSWNENREKSIIDYLKRVTVLIREEEWNNTHMVFGNKSFCFNTLEVEDFSPLIKSTITNDIYYEEGVDCPRFKQFLNEIFENDESRINVIQELLGYLLINGNKAQKIFYFVGSGSNGKSVLSDVITSLLSPLNVSNEDLNQLNSQFGAANLINKKANIANETEVGGGIETQLIKAISGDDRITVDIKREAHIDVVLFCKLIFLTNNLPATRDFSKGYFRRLMLIPFNRHFEEGEQDPFLKKKLEEELPGILNFAIDGLKRLVSNNYVFTHSKEIERMNTMYKEQQDPLEQFVADCLTFSEGARTSKKSVLESYKYWLNANALSGNGTESPQVFWKQLEVAVKKYGYSYSFKKIKGYDHLVDFELTFQQDLNQSLVITLP